jgi:murein L,D-transpeptidase YcbB/YkuD
MDNFKFTLFSIFILALLGLGGYWAFSTIETGSTHVDNQKQKELEQENQDLQKEVADLKRSILLLQADKEQAQIAANEPEKQQEATIPTNPTNTGTSIPTKTPVLKYQSLINELQKLVDGKIYLKNKSQGPAVGTVQKFLNIYNNTTLKIDNDYGATTIAAIKSFQKAQGLSQDGECGPGTYLKMISWLKTK